MDIKDIKLKKGMSREEVNELICEWILLEDNIYMGDSYHHKWRCKCGEEIEDRVFSNIKHNQIKCKICRYNEREKRYKFKIEENKGYKYIRSFRKGDLLPNGKILTGTPHIQVEHQYCEHTYTINASSFINDNQRCPNCCQEYENSFAHHIEVELEESLEKYWDFENNTVNPYHIYKNYEKTKVWIKCISDEANELNGLLKKEYHESYDILCSDFISGKRCPYCSSRRINYYDSFGYYHIKMTHINFIDRYWSSKNTINPFNISPRSAKKVILICQNKDYHDEYTIGADSFMIASRKGNNGCPYCSSKKIHKLDSLGTLYPYISDMICDEVDVFSIAPYSREKVYVKCPDCKEIQSKKIKITNLVSVGKISCEYCSDGISIPEKFIANILKDLNVEFESQKLFEWSRNINNVNYRNQDTKIYDIYINKYHTIIELHGRQHYEECSLTSRTLAEEQENDELKKDLALRNGIVNYMVIDCHYSEFNYIYINIQNQLEKYFDLHNVDFKKIWGESQTSLCVKAWEMWNKGLDIDQISKDLNLSTTTIRTYLNRGKEIEKCSYDGGLVKRKYHNPYKLKLTKDNVTYKCFDSISSLCRELEISRWFYDKLIKSNDNTIDKRYFCNYPNDSPIFKYHGYKIEYIDLDN